jgi:hypothetical protein
MHLGHLGSVKHGDKVACSGLSDVEDYAKGSQYGLISNTTGGDRFALG